MLVLALAAMTATAIAALEAAARLLDPPIADANRSPVVLDRHGRLLRAFTNSDGRWRMGLAPHDVDAGYLAMLFAFEDQRFHRHHGIDPFAMARAGGQMARHRRVVSGASTLTMQVARLIDGGHERGLGKKLHQAARARQLEITLTKTQILELYLERAPFGGNIEGVRAASLAYFGKEPRRLSAAEAALLVAIPQSPEARRPDRSPQAARRARDRVLDRAVAAGVLAAAEALRAKGEPVPAIRREFPKFAPHLSEAEVARRPAEPEHRLTLDRDLQSAVETLAREQIALMGAKLSAAILVVDHATGEVLAHVGSSDYFDPGRSGPIDMVEAVRSPGSTLKPLVYGLAFEAGLARPETLIEDRPVRFGSYRPENFDEEFRGTVTIREALAHSLNIPAVKVLEAVGPGLLVRRLGEANVAVVLPSGAEPSLAIALGGAGLRLKDLAALYAGLARGGDPAALVWRLDGTDRASPPRGRLLSPEAAWYVTDILKDAPPPPGSLSGRIAYKTGTSYGYRDAWAAGYDGRHAVAAWVGRPDGAPAPGILGRTSAAPLLFDAFARIGPARAPLPEAPPGVAPVSTAALPPPLRRFADEGDFEARGAFLESPVAIAFPPDHADVDLGGAGVPMVLKADGGVTPLTWLADGAPIGGDPYRRELVWTPEGRGFVRLTVVDAKGRADRVIVRLR